MPKADLKKLGATLYKWRKTRGFTRDALSEECHISSRHLANIEAGKINPSFDVLCSLVNALNISADMLFYPEMSEQDERTKLLLVRFASCSEESQELVLRTVDCMTDFLIQQTNGKV